MNGVKNMNYQTKLKLTAEFPMNTAVMIFSILMLAVVMSDPSSPSGMLPLILCIAVLIVYLLSSIPDLFFWYELTEDTVTIYWRKQLVAVVPW